MKQKLLIIIAFLSLGVAQGQDRPIDVSVKVHPPYHLGLSGLTNQLLATVRNTNVEEPIENVNFKLELYGPKGLHIFSSRVFNDDIDLEPGEVRTFIGGDWEALYGSTDLIIEPSSEEQRLRDTQAFREGTYQICISAYSSVTGVQLSKGVPSDCDNFQVEALDPPKILFPQNSYKIIDSNIPLDVNWFQLVVFGPHPTYDLEIVDITTIDQSGYASEDGFSRLDKVFSEEDISAFNFLVEDVDWQEGHEYAIRVTSRVGNLEGVAYEDKLHSRLTTISFEGDAVVAETPVFEPEKEKDEPKIEEEIEENAIVDTGELNAIPHFPIANDTIPFLKFPLVVKFSPEDKKITRMDYATNFNNKTRKDHKTWSNGALAFLNKAIRPDTASWSQASKIPVLDVTESDNLQRGNSYHWSDNIKLSQKGSLGKTTIAIPRQNFVIGMPKPIQELPKKDSIVPKGDITFKWKTGVEPNNLMPDYQLIHIDKNNKEIAPLGDIHEKWVLQIYNKENSTNKEDLAHQFSGDLNESSDEFLTSPATRAYDKTGLSAKLYTDLTQTFNITDEGTYWWRIAWLKDPKVADIAAITESDLYHSTVLRPFVVGKEEDKKVPTTDDTDTSCTSNCVVAEPSKTGVTAIAVGNTAKIGKFDLKIITISSSANDKYSGTGTINVPFLNNINVKVDFKDIQVNAENKIYAGVVNALKDDTFITKNDKVVEGLTTMGMDKANAESLDNAVSDASKSVYDMTMGSEATLPLGMNFEVDGHRIILAIMDIDFKATTANMNAVALVDVPIEGDTGNVKTTINFGVKDLCFNPDGLGSDIRLYVPEDIVLNPEGDTKFSIKGYSETGSEKVGEELGYTYLKWDCEGFNELHLALKVEFARDVIVPENNAGKPAKTGNVIAEAHFNVKKEDASFNFLAQIKFSSPFQLPDENAYGWGFEAKNVWLDLSNIANPKDIKFPEGYQFGEGDARLTNTWKGFWIEKLEIKAPHFIDTAIEDDKKIEVSATNFIIDPKVSFSFLIEDLVPLSKKATLEGSHISIDTLSMKILRNSFVDAGFTGRIALPIAEDKPSQMFKYNVLVDNSKSEDGDGKELGMVMAAKPAKDDIEILSKGLMMKGTLAKTSFIEVGFKSDLYTAFKVDGTFNFSTEFGDSDKEEAFTLDMAEVKIEGLEFDTRKEDAFECDDCFNASLASPQKFLSGFPITIDDVSISSEGLNPVLTIVPRVTLMGENNGFDVTTEIDITGRLGKVNGAWDFGLEKAELKKIELKEGTKLGGLSVHGFLEFYKDTNTKGTRGEINVLLPGEIGGKMSADFGVHKEEGVTAADFDKSNKYYSYWYVDGMIIIGTGMPMGAISLYGLGGGASHHMTMGGLPSASGLATGVKNIGDKDNKEAANKSGTAYTPSYETGLGIKFTTLLGSPGGGDVYNFDVTLLGEFNNNGGLRKLGLEGNARILANQGNPFTGDAPMKAQVKFGMENIDDPAKLLITGNLVIALNMEAGPTYLRGIGKAPATPGYTGPTENILVDASFLSDKATGDWYFVMGTPKNRAGVKMGIELGGKEIDIATTTGYFLAGNSLDRYPNDNITLGLPQPSKEFLEIQSEAQGNTNFRAEEYAADADNYLASQVTSNKGFQFGLAFSMNQGAEIMPFYYDLKMAVGFDLLMKNVDQCVGSRTKNSFSPPGKDGWYSEGQFYAGISGDFGLFVDILFIEGKYSIFSAAAALKLQGNFPNPDGFRGEGDIGYSILGGLVEGNYHFALELGEQCVAVSNPGDALNDLEIIQDLKPSGSADDVSVFANPAASFMIPMNERFEIPISRDEIKTVKPIIKSWVLKEKNGATVKGQIQLRNKGIAATLDRVKMLKGKKTYTQTIRVEAYEIIGNKETPIIDTDTKKAWFNERKTTFKTAESPNVIAPENIQFTYPLEKQTHFLKKETKGNSGYISMKQAQNQDGKVFDRSTDKDFVARFIKIDGTNKTKIETAINLVQGDRTAGFKVNKLENDQVYLVQLLSKKKAAPASSSSVTTTSDPVNSAQSQTLVTGMENNKQGQAELPKDMPLFKTLNLIESSRNLLTINGSTVNIKENKLPDDLIIDASEKILYKYYFKTSKYNTFKEKVTGLTWTDNFKESPYTSGERATFNSTWSELPEKYDQKAYKVNKARVGSLIDVTINDGTNGYSFPENNYSKYVKKNIITPYYNIRKKFKTYGLSTKRINLIDFTKGVKFSQESRFDNPLSSSEIQHSFEANDRNLQTGINTLKEAKEEMSEFKEQNSFDTADSATNTNGFSSSTGGYLFATQFAPSLDVPAPQVQIEHRMPYVVKQNFTKIKNSLQYTYYRQLRLWDHIVREGDHCYGLATRVDNNNYYVNKYSNKYSQKQLTNYLVKPPYAYNFIYTFDNQLYRNIAKLKQAYKFVRYPRYGDNNNPPKNSFILQYRYPVPDTEATSNASMKKGTFIKVHNYN